MLANSIFFSKVKTEFSIDGILELIYCITAQNVYDCVAKQ